MKRTLEEPELKFVDYHIPAKFIGLVFSWSVFDDVTTDSIAGVALGDTGSSRNGRVYWIHSLEMNGALENSQSEDDLAPANGNVVRVLVVIDHHTNGAQLVGANVMTEPGNFSWTGFPILANESRYEIIYDRITDFNYPVMNQGVADEFAVAAVKRHFRWNVEFDPPLRVTCTGDSANIADISDTSIHVLATRQGGLPGVQMWYTVRVRFTDGMP